ncbi:MAG: cofactor-independent phosphoglycerate mutase [Planctomycetes bacterium]|nr:cofactor-independent phosphoglycerate mutase [Planctomycetota bacterium]
MKYILVVPDGAADEPIADLGNATVFEAADTPTLDRMTREGRLGLAATVPEGMHPGSDVANMSLLGYDPRVGYTGRAALEAAAMGVTVPAGDVVFRANTVTIAPDGTMADYSAGHIPSEEAAALIGALNQDLHLDGIRLFPGVGYRHLCLMQGGGTVPDRTPAHELVGEPVDQHQPRGGQAARVVALEEATARLLPGYEVNARRVRNGQPPANRLWLWGGATAMRLDGFCPRMGLGSAGLITAVDLMRGIGVLAGMDILEVDGATAYLDTNYAGKGRAALDYLRDHDFVAVHVEAPDEAGHNGDLAGKIRALEDIDRPILEPLFEAAHRSGDWRILVAPDHPTPIATRVHSADPVPFLMWGANIAGNGAARFGESEASRVGGAVWTGCDILRNMIHGDG